MISWKTLKELINATLEKIRTEQHVLEAEVVLNSRKVATLEEERLQAYRALAKMRFDEITASTVVSELTAAEQKARDKFGVFTRLCDQIQVERRALEAQISQAQEQRTKIENQIFVTQAEIDALTNSTRKRLDEDAEWVGRLHEMGSLQQKLGAATQKALESEADRENKSKPYLADDVFRYLFEKKFGSSAYAGSGWIRWGDERVAKTIRFESARRDFIMLNELPGRLREHVDGLRQTLDAQAAEMEKRFRAETEQDGICALEEKLDAQNQTLKALIQKTDVHQAALLQNHARHDSLTEGSDENGLSAVLAIIVKALQSQSLSTLMQKAEATPEPEDDELVHRLEKLKASLPDAQKELRQSREQVKALQERELQLEDAKAHMASKCYYDGSFRDEGGIRDAIDGIYLGKKLEKTLIALLDENFFRAYDWEDRSSRSRGSSRSGSSSSDWSWSSSSSSDSGFGGGSFSTGGGSGGGGFRTGGGF
jgi:DNA repair exonuclease SbcCD ATPase subunit